MSIPTVADIQRATCRYFGVSRLDMISARRSKSLIRPRHIAVYLAKTMTLDSLPKIGTEFGQRHHTTILHATRKIKRELAIDEELSSDVAALQEIINRWHGRGTTQ